jgi:hypothetical protein
MKKIFVAIVVVATLIVMIITIPVVAGAAEKGRYWIVTKVAEIKFSGQLVAKIIRVKPEKGLGKGFFSSTPDNPEWGAVSRLKISDRIWAKYTGDGERIQFKSPPADEWKRD